MNITSRIKSWVEEGIMLSMAIVALAFIEWVHENKGRDRGSYRPRDLELVSENR